MNRNELDVAVIGAGPYGLAAAAHLKGAKIATKAFGQPMSFWQQNMPKGMRLRSPWIASHIAHPDDDYDLDRYVSSGRLTRQEQMPVGDFIRYGQWFQKNAVPDLDHRIVMRVERTDSGFRLHLDDGDKVSTGRVVIAMGLKHQECKPSVFSGLPHELVSHTSDHVSFAPLKGKRVAVIGRGQSACETAALLGEEGIDVELISRGEVLWIGEDSGEHGNLAWKLRKVMMTRGAVGPFPLNWIAEAPALVHYFPQLVREEFNERCLRAKASGWLRARFGGVHINSTRIIEAARAVKDGVEIRLDNESKVFDHIILGTGYKIDIAKLGILEPGLLKGIATINGSPRLSVGMESSVEGLHFAGATAVHSFGPLMRFVWGAGFAARSLTQSIMAKRAQSAWQKPVVSGMALNARSSQSPTR
jgi:cation diffusion facilitator CzcD-associated flavoprotein CzcO